MSDEAPVPEADVAPAILQRNLGPAIPTVDGDVATATFNRSFTAAVVEPEAAQSAEAASVAEEPVSETPQVIEPEPAPAIVESDPEPIVHAEAPPAPPVNCADAFSGNAKQAVADALAAQPFHGTTVMFDDLVCVANAIIDSIAAEMRS